MTRKIPAIFDRTTFSPLFDNSVGFDSLFDRIFDDFLPSANSVTFPPYNIIKGVDEHSRIIEMALAGYGEEDIDITIEKGNTLVIKGGKSNNQSPDNEQYVYHGVAARSFERKFVLADNAEVTEARMKNGMLYVSVNLKEPEEEKVKRITIST